MTELKLLDDVKKLRKKYEREKDFNVFDAIRFRSQEVMHSKFIATLLDPKGQHKMGTYFLEKFLDKMGYSGFKPYNVKIKTERRAGKRRIDIAIENIDTILIIENKLEAKDLPEQLEDYYKFCKKNTVKKVEVLYLTRYGHKPSEYSLGETIKQDNIDIKLISYEKHIIPWIFECSNKIEVGRLKSSLEMYREILQIAINRSLYMNEIFEKLKMNKSNLKSAIDIASTLQGRNYIKEFPEIKSLMKELVEMIIDEPKNIYFDPERVPMEEVKYIAITEIPDVEDWCIHFYEQVYLSNDKDKSRDITLFDCTDFNNKLLQSLLKEDKETASEILRNELKRIYSFL